MLDKRDTQAQPGEREALGWDAFTGPTHLMPDDRSVPSHLLPVLAATHGMRLAAEMNFQLLRRLTGAR